MLFLQLANVEECGSDTGDQDHPSGLRVQIYERNAQQFPVEGEE